MEDLGAQLPHPTLCPAYLKFQRRRQLFRDRAPVWIWLQLSVAVATASCILGYFWRLNHVSRCCWFCDGNASPHMQSRLLNMPRLGLPPFCCSWFYCHFRNKPQHIKAPREGSFKSPWGRAKSGSLILCLSIWCLHQLPLVFKYILFVTLLSWITWAPSVQQILSTYSDLNKRSS